MPIFLRGAGRGAGGLPFPPSSFAPGRDCGGSDGCAPVPGVIGCPFFGEVPSSGPEPGAFALVGLSGIPENMLAPATTAAVVPTTLPNWVSIVAPSTLPTLKAFASGRGAITTGLSEPTAALGSELASRARTFAASAAWVGGAGGVG